MRRLLLALALVVLPACKKPAPPPPASRTVTDTTGRAVALPPAVKRVISLAPSSTEMVFALGAGDRVVGLDRYSNWPPAVRDIERVGADIDPSLERIVALKPDLVLAATTANSRSTVDALERIGLPVYISGTGNLEMIFADVQAIGDALGEHDRARALAAELRARIDRVRAGHAAQPVLAAVVVWTEPLTLAGPGSHVADLLAAAGGRNVVDESAIPFPTYSVERLLARAPEVLVVGSHADNAPPLTPLLRLTTLPAIAHHRVHFVDGDVLFRPGPRVAEAAEILARILDGTADGGAP